MKKIKKIKKDQPVPAKEIGAEALKTTADLLEFIKSNNDEKREPKEKAINYIEIPSKRPIFTSWKRTNFEDWKGKEFVGYYLSKYVELIGEEDPEFKRANAYQFTSERKFINDCLKFVFNSDAEKFKDYIDFIIPWWMSDESFVSGIPQYRSVFTRKVSFYNAYLASKHVKPKSRKDMDNHFASAGAWDSFIEDDE